MDSGALLAISGLQGTGKSSLCERICAQAFNGRNPLWVRQDLIRKELWGVSPLEKLPSEAYLPEFTRLTYLEANRRILEGLQEGRVVLCDRVNQDRKAREDTQTLAELANAFFVGVWLETPISVRLDRVRNRRNDASDFDVSDFEKQMSIDPGANNWPRINAGYSRDETLRQTGLQVTARLPAIGRQFVVR